MLLATLLVLAAAAPPAPPEDAPFSLGSYGRVIVGSDLADRPGASVNVVGRGPRLVERSYQELNFSLRLLEPKADRPRAHLVTALAIGEDLFHYTGRFDATLAVRNMFVIADDVLAPGVSFWAGSRMYRGDDLYLLDWWPLDGLNTVGGGAAWKEGPWEVALHVGLNRLDNGFQLQVLTSPVEGGIGARPENLLDRQRTITSLRTTYLAGTWKVRGYLERHDLPGGEITYRNTGEVTALPRDSGWVVGAQLAGWREGSLSGAIFARLGLGLGAYGDLQAPVSSALDRTQSGARMAVLAAGGAWEQARFAIPVALSLSSFHDPADLAVNRRSYEDFVIDARPVFYASDVVHLAADVSWQIRAPHSLTDDGTRALSSSVFSLGLVPMIVPGGTGLWTRPAIRLMYVVRHLSEDARAQLYGLDDPRRARAWSQFFGIGVEWWFNSSYR